MSIFRERIKTETLPIIALKDFVIFPHITASLDLDNKEVLRVIREANKGPRLLVIATLKEENDGLNLDNVYSSVAVARIKKKVEQKKEDDWELTKCDNVDK